MRRSFLRIISDMLSSAKNGAGKTHIMYESRISYDQLKAYLSILIKQGLIEKDGVIYRTTEKGVLFIKKLREIEELLNDAPQADV